MTKLLLLILLLSFSKSFGQSNDLEARAACLKGEEAFENGNYSKAIAYLEEAKSKLVETKPRIQYTLVRALRAAGRYPEAKKELKTFFDVTPEDNSEEHFLEMVKSIADLNESEKLEENKIREVQLQEQQRLIAIERERKQQEDRRLEEQRMAEVRRLEEQRAAEAKRLEAERLELEYNKKMAVAGTWELNLSDVPAMYGYPLYVRILLASNSTASVKFAYRNSSTFSFQYIGTPSNCPSNFCRMVEGILTVTGGKDGILYHKAAKEVLNIPCKFYMNEIGSKLIMEYEAFDIVNMSNKFIFRDYLKLKGYTLKIELDRYERYHDVLNLNKLKFP